MGLGLIFALLPVAIWLVPALLRTDGAFAYALLWEQSAGRISGNMEASHPRPFYFYVLLLSRPRPALDPVPDRLAECSPPCNAPSVRRRVLRGPNLKVPDRLDRGDRGDLQPHLGEAAALRGPYRAAGGDPLLLRDGVHSLGAIRRGTAIVVVVFTAFQIGATSSSIRSTISHRSRLSSLASRKPISASSASIRVSSTFSPSARPRSSRRSGKRRRLVRDASRRLPRRLPR